MGQRRVLHHPTSASTSKLAAVNSLPGSAQLTLSLGLPLRNEEALTNLLEALYDPASALYHHYLSVQEFADRFGASESDYQSLIRFAESNGLKVVATHPNRLVLDVRGSAADIEKTFATQLKLYAHPLEERQFFAPAIEPSVEASVPLLDVSGLDSFVLPRPMSLHRAAATSPAPNAGSAPGGSYQGNDFRAAYAPGVALTGVGQSVGLLEFDGYYANDIATYEADAGLPNVPVQNVLLDGLSGAAGSNNDEVAMDIEVAIAMAPGLSSVIVYEGSSPNSILSKMASENRAKQLSSSWTYTVNNTTENLFRQFAAQGQTMFQASGDVGAYATSIPAPADDPNLTIVGGTTLSTSGSGGVWTSETAWNWGTGIGNNATSGGSSLSFTMPSYQQGVSMSQNQGSPLMRNIPDVALTADGVWVVWNNGSKGTFGGTSAATPLWAAFMALVNQQAMANGRATMGFANPSLYTIGKGANYSACFHDVTAGNNFNSTSPTKFAAVAGFDLCTGWGTPAGQPLINALAGGSNLPPSFKSNPFVFGSINAGQPCSGSISNQATVPNPSDRITFAKQSGPAWLTINSDGSLSGTPASADVGTNIFVVSATESAGMFSRATMYLNVNGPPSFANDSFSEPSGNAGQSYSGSIAGEASDPNPGDVLAYAKVNGPAWLTISASGALSGTPAVADGGTNVFIVSVTDQGGLSATATMSIAVQAPPSFTSDPIAAPAVSVGQSYSGSLSNQAKDPNPGATLTFSKSAGPAWLVVAADGTLSGTPSAQDVGTNSFSVKVADSSGMASTATMNVPVVPSSGMDLQIASQAGRLSLTWLGGSPPFQVQISTNFANAWQNFGSPVTNRAVTLSPNSASALYRVRGGS